MRNLILLGIVAAGAFMAGWFTISRDGEHTTIQFNRGEIRNDAKVAIDRGREILNKQVQPRTQDASTQYTPQSAPYGQPSAQGYAPNPQQPAQYQSIPENRTASNPQPQWNQPPSNYPPVQQASARATQWQQPQQSPTSQYPSTPYPGPPNDYQAPPQY